MLKMTDNERQFWNTRYTWRENDPENDPLMVSWRRFLIERGHTPQGVLRRVGKERMKAFIIEFLTGESQ